MLYTQDVPGSNPGVPMLKTDALVSAVAVFLSFLAVTLFLVVIGRSPSGMYQAILQAATGLDPRRGWNMRFIGEWFVLSLPIILCALSMGFSVRSGLFNLGVEGQYIAGLTAAQVIAVFFAGNQETQVFIAHSGLAVLGAMFAGAIWGSAAGLLKVRCKVSVVISTIMMNFIALYAHRLITMRIPGSNVFRTPDFSETALLSNAMLASITNNSRLHNGLWITAAAVLIYWLILNKTKFGFSLCASGFNRDNALLTGICVKANTVIAMTISGAFAGLAGAVVSLGMFTHGRVLTTFDGYGFIGIAAALAGNAATAGIAIMGLFFGILTSAQPLMELRQIPGEIAFVIMGLIVVFISFKQLIQMFTQHRVKVKVNKAQS